MKKITFTAVDEYFWNVAPKPFPAKQMLPKWWKDMTPYQKTHDNPDGKKLIIENFHANTTFKKCTPMLDSLTSGYIIPLWADVQVRQIDDNPVITWRVQQKSVFQVHGENSNYVETPYGYYSQVFKYMNGWIPNTPKGYSYLVTQPFGYKNLPFRPVSAIVDGDSSTLEILPPIWVKKGFEGIVEKGTPIIQIIPFKRDNWKSEFDYYKDGEYKILEEKTFNSTIVNNYIKNHWSKKDYK